MDTETPRQVNQPATWAEYHATKTYHFFRGRTRIRATEKPRSVKATARTFRREMRRVAGGQPLPCADLQRGGIRSPLAFPLEHSEHAAAETLEPQPARPHTQRRRLTSTLAMAAALAGDGLR